ncbi:hypothetical protein [Marinomonas polaris]|uniref:hypothetical protein n=1 Tax=Marinomonas polaris TaxID=293552 RepID=UPI003F9E2BB6
MIKDRSSRVNEHESVNLSDLVAGDILLYSPQNLSAIGIKNKVEVKEATNLADATKGVFSHAAIYLGIEDNSGLEGDILHTGPDGVFLSDKSVEFSQVNTGVYVVRLNSEINTKKLVESAKSSLEESYDFIRLPLVALAAWDRRCLQESKGICKYIPNQLSKKFVEKSNPEGSEKICSGLTLKTICDSSEEEVFPNKLMKISQFSPNCIYSEAIKEGNNAKVFELYPLSEDYLNKKPMHFIFAGLSLASTMGSKIVAAKIKEKYNKAFKSDS